jgi:sec-independent protein translocase protein TatB
MFLDGGAEEIMVVAVVALIFVGPKDLPVVLRKVGQFTAKMRGLAAEFRASFDEMARQSELDELKREVEALRRGEATNPVVQEIDEHFESLHREFGAPPPAGFGAREDEVAPGPDASPVHMLPIADKSPEPAQASGEIAAAPAVPPGQEPAG